MFKGKIKQKELSKISKKYKLNITTQRDLGVNSVENKIRGTKLDRRSVDT